MRKFLLFIVGLVLAASTQAQTKIAYIDLYQRGGWSYLRTDVIFDSDPVDFGRKNLGEMLNFLAEKGWVVDQTMIIPRHPFGFTFPATRHKFHIIMKKEYQEGENPFEGLRNTKQVEVEKDNLQKTRKEEDLPDQDSSQEQNNPKVQQLNAENNSSTDVINALLELDEHIKNITTTEEISYAKERLNAIRNSVNNIQDSKTTIQHIFYRIDNVEWAINQKEKKLNAKEKKLKAK